ncbi:LuxR C-terminal-related transcriptional regulator [Actinoplanes sp. NPDC026619]|uniref:LuxR C-terminal-related transcriptional regulator n=1 Tax=Actinoplanes sp. NPDC026619 TaxID=3155798 RepID=UPI0033C70CBA
MAEDLDPLASAAALLHRPALVVITGPPGSGRTTMLRRIAAAVPGPAHTGGGLAMLRSTPALALSRAVRARLPAHDVHLLAEAVRSRVRGGLLVLDDIQYADPATLAALPLLAAHCRVLVALRTPHRLPASCVEALQTTAAAWLTVPPLDREAALGLARHTAGGLSEPSLAAIVDRAGGNPLAISALARQAAAGRAPGNAGIDQIAYAIATALADLPRPARTALAALGLLGRPAPAALLGTGAADLHAAGLITAGPDGTLVPVSTYVAETAAGLLDAAGRVELHSRLAELTPPAEAARHLAAAGDLAGAHRKALQAADQAVGGERAALLLFACDLDTPIDTRVRLAAADAALSAGRAAAAAKVLTFGALPTAFGVLGPEAGVPTALGALGVEADVLRGEALLQAGSPAAARASVAGVSDASPAPVLAARDRVLLLAELATDPVAAQDLAEKVSARYPRPPQGVAAALAAVAAANRSPGWAEALSAVVALPGDPQIIRFSAWLLVEHLIADGRLTEAAVAAARAARECAADLSYGWQTRFEAAGDWAVALHGAGLSPVPGAGALSDTAGPGVSAPPAAGDAATTGGGDATVTGTAQPAAAGAAPTAGVISSAAGATAGTDQASRPDDPAPVPTSGAGPTGAGSGRAGLLWPGVAVPGPGLSGDAGRAGPGGAGGGAGSAGFAQAGEAAGSGAGAGGRPDRVLDEERDLTARTAPDEVLRRSGNLADRAIPDEARGYATAASALIEADTGLLGAARARLDAGPDHDAVGWVTRETAWLDGQPDRAVRETPGEGHGLIAGLHAITARWAAYDLGAMGAPPIPSGLPTPARRTLTAWATGTGFAAAADGWRPVALREQVRCLLAAGLTDADPGRAVDALLEAERLADAAGLTVLAGRARRGLRRHHVHRDTRSPRSGDQLTRRETDVLRLVAAGEPTRRIAGQLGISAETVDTHIRAGMRKLGARTRTEAAALAFATFPSSPEIHKDGR